MIRGGDHMEWPRDYFYDTAYDKEAEMEMDRNYEEAMWKQILKDGPPQDDDITWIKHKIWALTYFDTCTHRDLVEEYEGSELDAQKDALLEDINRKLAQL